VNIYEHNDLCI